MGPELLQDDVAKLTAIDPHRFTARLASSVVRPFEVRFKDVLDELYLASDRVEKVANALHLLCESDTPPVVAAVEGDD